MPEHTTQEGQPTGRVFDAGIDLLDQQLVDCNDHLSGKIDDLELTLPPSPTGADDTDDTDDAGHAGDTPLGDRGLPEVTALLVGPGALAERFASRGARGARAARAWAELHRRLHPSQPTGPSEVSFGLVKRIGNRIELTIAREELPLNLFEEWFRINVIEKLPGASHAAE